MTTLWKGGMLRTCLAAIFIAISQLLPAQTYFRNFSVSDGLSNNTVKSIAFDMDGFLWVGTEDGLNRYDGKTFETVLDFRAGLMRYFFDCMVGGFRAQRARPMASESSWSLAWPS